jgi:hypothetical protein
MSQLSAAVPTPMAPIVEEKPLDNSPWDNPNLTILNEGSQRKWYPQEQTTYVWLLMNPDELRVAKQGQVTLPFRAIKQGTKMTKTKQGMTALVGGLLVYRAHKGGWLLVPDPSLAGPPQTGRSAKPAPLLTLAQGLFKEFVNLTVVPGSL